MVLCPLPVAAGSFLNVVSVFLPQDIGVLPAGIYGRGNKVVFCLQPSHYLLSGFIIRFHAFSVKFSHDFHQTINSDLCIIRKFQYAPANYRLRGDSPVFSPFLFLLGNNLCAL